MSNNNIHSPGINAGKPALSAVAWARLLAQKAGSEASAKTAAVITSEAGMAALAAKAVVIAELRPIDGLDYEIVVISLNGQAATADESVVLTKRHIDASAGTPACDKLPDGGAWLVGIGGSMYMLTHQKYLGRVIREGVSVERHAFIGVCDSDVVDLIRVNSAIQEGTTYSKVGTSDGAESSKKTTNGRKPKEQGVGTI